MLRIGNGFDVHKFQKGKQFILGGVQILYEKGLVGHSDADALTHSLIDALLGAVGLRDIGYLFPDNEKQFKNICSLILLRQAYNQVQTQGYHLENMDSTIICENPKLSSYIPRMKELIAETLEVDIDFISIKATTTEGLGLIGRGEGIGVLTNVLLQN